MKIALYILGGLVVLVLIVVAIGYSLPQSHTVSRERTFAAPPDRVFAVISAPQDFPAWRTGVKSVDILAPVNGKPQFREKSGDGDILYQVDEMVSGQRLVTRIADPALPFGGKWTFALTPAGTGTTLRITEDGEVYNPVFRFMSRFVFGHASTIEKYMADLERRLAA